MNTEQYESVWTGATWRTYPQPVLAQGVVAVETRCDQQRFSSILRSILTCDWQTVTIIREAASRQGLPARRLGEYLSRLVKSGRIEVQQDGARGQARSYRRIMAQELTPESRILAVLTDTPKRQKAIRQAAQMDIHRLRRALESLEALKLIERFCSTPSGAGRPQFLYRLAAQTRQVAA